MDIIAVLLGSVPSILTIIGGVWHLSARISTIAAKTDQTAIEQVACNARHDKATEVTNNNVDKLEYRVDKLGNRVTALETRNGNR